MLKSEKRNQNLLCGELSDKALSKARDTAKNFCLMYNNLNPNKKKKREKLIKTFFGKTKERCKVSSPFYCDYGYNIEIGENFKSNIGLTILDVGKVIFGDNVLVGPNCNFLAVGHPVDVERRNKKVLFAEPIIVGNNVWIGGNVTVLHGVTIGNNSVIGCGSVVTKDIPDGVVAFGNPCKVYRKITDKDKEKNKLL